MSLRVWLPLNGNLNNQGDSNCAITSSNLTVDTSGKIGSCYSFNGSTSCVEMSYTDFPTILNGDFSICLWIYNNDNNDRSILFGNYGLTGQYLNIEKYANNAVRMWWNGNPDINFSSCVLTNTSWSHLAITRKSNTVNCYINGVLKQTSTTALSGSIPTTATTFRLGRDNRSDATAFNGKLNDFRLYDHALSAKEVKEISKGLICHYPLDGNGKGRDNYFINSNFYTGTTSNWSGVNSSSISIATKDDRKCITATKGTSSFLFCQTISSYDYTAGTVLTYTISLDVYVEETGTINIGNWISTTQASGWQGMSYTKRWNSASLLSIGWNHVSVTMLSSKHASYSGKIITGFSYSGTTMYATNIKFEFGDIDTPWCPNSADSIYTTLGYNNTIEYDTSGYKNNGTRTNIEVSNANSPKYSAASYFKGSSYIACGRNTMVTDAITINVWVYSSNWTNYVKTLASCTESGGWSFGISGSNFNWYMGTGTSSNTYKTISIAASTFTAGWHMITVTYDGLAVKGYIDAVLKGTNAAYTEKTPIFYNASNGVFIGAEAGGNQTTPAGSYSACNMSDFRIYATALSADDIKELYQIPASITNNGAIICYDFTEN